MNFEAVYLKYVSLVYNVALQYVQNIPDAEEITQDVFIKVYEKQEGFKGDSALKTWIYRITINTSLDAIKAKSRKKRAVFANRDDAALDRLGDFNHPGVALENKEALALLFKAINQLPDTQRTVLILLKVDDLSQQEVAKILNKTQKSVESTFQRAKQNLKKILNKTEGL